MANSQSFDKQDERGKRNERYSMFAMENVVAKTGAFRVLTFDGVKGVKVIVSAATHARLMKATGGSTATHLLLPAIWGEADASVGKKFDAPAGWLSSKHWHTQPQNYFPDYDFMSKATGRACEAKLDEASVKSRRLYFEFQQQAEIGRTNTWKPYKPSGYEVTKAESWTSTLPGGIIFLFDTDDVRAACAAQQWRIGTCFNKNDEGKNVRTQGRCIPLDELIRFIGERNAVAVV